jgi:hypothetical protein
MVAAPPGLLLWRCVKLGRAAACAGTPLGAPSVTAGAGLGQITLDAPLLDHRVGARHRPVPPMGRKAAPKQQRQHQAKRPSDHQDDPDRVDAEPRGGDVHRIVPPAPIARVGGTGRTLCPCCWYGSRHQATTCCSRHGWDRSEPEGRCPTIGQAIATSSLPRISPLRASTQDGPGAAVAPSVIELPVRSRASWLARTRSGRSGSPPPHPGRRPAPAEHGKGLPPSQGPASGSPGSRRLWRWASIASSKPIPSSLDRSMLGSLERRTGLETECGPTSRSIAWCAASIWSAPDGSALLRLNASAGTTWCKSVPTPGQDLPLPHRATLVEA